MASSFTTAVKNTMLDAVTVDRVMLHSGDPGAAGANNQESGLVAASFDAASNGERPLASDVNFTSLTPSVAITWFSVWLNSGTVFKGKGQITDGDLAANAAGEYTLVAGSTKLTITDPA